MVDSERQKIGYWAVVSIGIGGMVGGGIFAVLGLAAQLGHGGTPVAFFIAGMVALVTSYSYAKMSVRYPNQGGTVIFVDRAFGVDLFTGSINILLWLSYIIMLSLYSYAFGTYGAALFGVENSLLAKHALISISVIGLTALNLLSSSVVGRAESYIVALKVTLLVLFIAIGFKEITPSQLAPGTWSHPVQLIAGGMIIFVAYEGFELIANTAQDVRNPATNLPRAYYTAVGFVIVLYMLVAAVTVGTLPMEKIIAARDYVLAEAAKPFLGNLGFRLIALTAMLSTLSAINATLYGAARLSYTIAKERELPEILERKIWNKPIEGLLITSVLTLMMANTVDLSSIATMGSAGFLIIFAAVNASNVVLAKETGSSRLLSIVGLVACLGSCAALVYQVVLSDPKKLWILAILFGLSLLIELIYGLFKGRKLTLNI
jgi:amino acid transporter